MKNKAVYFSILLYITIIIQTTLLNYISIYNIKPNLILIFIICIALIKGGLEGAFVGLIAGLLQDILSGSSIGPNALLGFLVGFSLGGFNKRFYKDNIFACAIITFIISIIYESIFVLPYIPINDYATIISVFKSDILVEAIYNVVMCLPIYILILKINNKIDYKEKTSNKY